MNDKKLPWANKNLGQHFLHDQKVIDTITEDFKGEYDAIIEIGPGPGILTDNLSQYDLPYYVFEKDLRFEDYLTQYIKREQIQFGDALKVDIKDFLAEKNIVDKKVWLVSNLPYNIGVPLLINFIQEEDIKLMTLMFQKEVADKVVPFMTKKNSMGSLHALASTYFEVSLLQKVSPGCFLPPPKVDSAVISLRRRENPIIDLSDFSQFETFLRKLFQFKRKQVGKVLKAHFQLNDITKAAEDASFQLTDRAESFNLEQVQILYKSLVLNRI